MNKQDFLHTKYSMYIIKLILCKTIYQIYIYIFFLEWKIILHYFIHYYIILILQKEKKRNNERKRKMHTNLAFFLIKVSYWMSWSKIAWTLMFQIFLLVKDVRKLNYLKYIFMPRIFYTSFFLIVFIAVVCPFIAQ